MRQEYKENIMQTNITAFTAGGFYPPFLSINLLDSGEVEVIVRSEAKLDGSCGDCSSIKLNMDQFLKVSQDMYLFRRTGL